MIARLMLLQISWDQKINNCYIVIAVHSSLRFDRRASIPEYPEYSISIYKLQMFLFLRLN